VFPNLAGLSTASQVLPFREFITGAFPSFQFHRLYELLIDLLQQVADGKLTRLIVCCPPHHGKLGAHATPVPIQFGDD
jgi:hypothetical protein